MRSAKADSRRMLKDGHHREAEHGEHFGTLP
jgi:hypothetical protein